MNTKHLLILAASSLALPLNAVAEITVKPVGMQIVWSSLKDEFDGHRTYNNKEGVYVAVALNAGGKNIIAFDDKKSKVSILSGDEDLGGKFDSWEKFSKDGKIMRVEAKTEKLPTGDAAALKLSGSMSVVVASKSETKSIEPRALKKGDKLTFGDDFTCEVTKIDKPKYGDDQLEISLKWKQNIPRLAEIRFFDKDGKKIESRKGGWSSFGAFGKRTITQSYLLKKKSDLLKIEMDLWTDAEALVVPIDLGIGFSASK